MELSNARALESRTFNAFFTSCLLYTHKTSYFKKVAQQIRKCNQMLSLFSHRSYILWKRKFPLVIVNNDSCLFFEPKSFFSLLINAPFFSWYPGSDKKAICLLACRSDCSASRNVEAFFFHNGGWKFHVFSSKANVEENFFLTIMSRMHAFY